MRFCILILVLSVGFFGCSKGGETSSSTPKPPPVVGVEPSLTATNGVTVDIDPGPTNIYAVVGTSQKMEVRLVAMPASGVTIETKLIKLLDNTTLLPGAPHSSQVTALIDSAIRIIP